MKFNNAVILKKIVATPEIKCNLNRCSNCEMNLDNLCPDEQGWITELPENILLPFLGFRPGKKVCLVTRQRFNGPLVLKIDGRCVAISRTIAKNIKVLKTTVGENVVKENV